MERARMVSASASSSSTRLPPPLYWNVPDSQKNGKDYITENMHHVRQVSNQAKKSKSKEGLEPLRAKFIPGLTKNPKYDHVESRIVGLIHGTTKFGPDSGTRLNNSNSSISLTSKEHGTNGKGQDLKPIWGASTAANARRIKSTSDVRKSNSSTVIHRRPVALKPHEESVYNWRFPDHHQPQDAFAGGDFEEVTEHQEINELTGQLSSRSSRMTQTMSWPPDDGRGDFTRFNSGPTQQPNNQPSASSSMDRMANGKSGSLNALNKEMNGSTSQLTSSSLRSAEALNREGNTSTAPLTTSKSMTAHALGVPTSDSYPSPHKTGTIPKYLKKRQQQWKEDEIARQEAEKDASIPPGHVAMSESERQDNLTKLKNSYDSLVNELNRIPISIDTIRVRHYKQNLEQELCKLEQAMKLFSRPQVYIKI